MILSQINELKDIGMPWLNVNSESARAFVPSLVDIPSSCVICTKHGDDSVRVSVGTGNVRSNNSLVHSGVNETKAVKAPCSANAMDIQPNATSGLADHCTVL
jgi:hypothetical protein